LDAHKLLLICRDSISTTSRQCPATRDQISSAEASHIWRRDGGVLVLVAAASHKLLICKWGCRWVYARPTETVGRGLWLASILSFDVWDGPTRTITTCATCCLYDRQQTTCAGSIVYNMYI